MWGGVELPDLITAYSRRTRVLVSAVMQTLTHDRHYGPRKLLKKPEVTLIAVGALSLCTGANAAIFN